MTTAAPFKENVGSASVAALASAVLAMDPRFPAEKFCRESLDGLDALELKARVRQVANALDRCLAGRFGHRAYIVVAALDRVDRLGASLDWWAAWPAVEFVGAAGIDRPGRSLDALGRLTRHATAEFAVRPYLTRHTELAWQHVWTWAASSDAHQRRLASEGTRPRLPWGTRVPALLVAGTTVPLLDKLRDDPSADVRRSVANHLNDVARDHPDLAVAVAARWVADDGEHVRSVVRHALRGLLRAGHPGAMKLLGIGHGAAGGRRPQVDSFDVSPGRVSSGQTLRLTATVRSTNPGAAQQMLVQYAIAGPRRRKVYFVGERTLPGGGVVTISRRHLVRHTTTRAVESGTHTVELLVNGRVRAAAEVDIEGEVEGEVD